MVSGSISLPYSGCFSPFPHGTSSLSVSQEYLALPDGAGGFKQDFSGPALLRILLGNKSISCTGLSPYIAKLSRMFHYQFIVHVAVLQPHTDHNRCGLGCSLFARHYLGNHNCFLFLQVLRCFSSLGWPPYGYYNFIIVGCPIRKSGDRKLLRTSPQLIAAYHVLHRL